MGKIVVRNLLGGNILIVCLKSLLVCSILLQLYITLNLNYFTWCFIPSSAMYPVLFPGDCVFLSLYSHDEINVERNEIIVFHYPYTYGIEQMEKTYKKFYCKRCVALPGDSFYVDFEGVYRIKGKEELIIGNVNAQKKSEKIHVNYDSLYIPMAGDELVIDERNYKFYRKCIEYETGNKLAFRNDTAYLDDIPIERYKFVSNYYYMAGDNVSASYDSRYWGVVPEDFLFGKAIFILYSEDEKNGKIRMERFFKRL